LAFPEAVEEVLVGSLQPLQHVLQDLCVDLGKLGAGPFQIGQLVRLVVVVERDPTPFPRRLALFHAHIVERAAAPQDRIQRPFLLRCRVQSILVGFAHALCIHATLFRLPDADPEYSALSSPYRATRLSSPWLKPEVLSWFL